MLAMRVAGASDRAAGGDEAESAFRRLVLPAAKYWLCKRAPVHAAEALECFGGNGYVEDFEMARLYREAPVNSVWEGSGNVAALDVLRAISRNPAVVEAYFAEVEQAAGADARLDHAVSRLRKELGGTEEVGARARRVAECLALVLQGSLLVRHGHPAVADAFVASRLDGDWGAALGTLPARVDAVTIVDRARVDRSPERGRPPTDAGAVRPLAGPTS